MYVEEYKREKKEIGKRTNATTPIAEPTSITRNLDGVSSPKNSTEDGCCLNLTTSKKKQSLDPTKSERDNFDHVKTKQCLDPTRTKTKTCDTVVPIDSTSPKDLTNAVREEDVVTTSNINEEDRKDTESRTLVRDNGETIKMKNKNVDTVTSKLQSFNTFRRSQQMKTKKFSSVASSNDNAYRKVRLIPTKNLSESDSSSILSSSPSPPGINDLADDVPIDVNARQNLQRLKELLADRRERFFDVVGLPRLFERSESSRGKK